MRAPDTAPGPVELRPGSRFGGYRIEAAVGRGGMATVYRAEHVHLRRQVAIKVPIPELADDAGFRERFVRESRAAAGLAHPHLVAVYDAGEIDGVLFLAMQFVEGDDLGRAIKHDGPLPPARAVAFIGQIAGALDAAHAHGLVHRDVKPANVLVEGDHCYVADFGLTKLTAATAATMTGDVLGTLSYAAPEQIEGGVVDRRADVYALGCTAYECLVGVTPFAHRSGAALLYAQLTEPPPRASDHSLDLPAAVDPVLTRALAKRPEDRYASCGELAAALAEALGPGTVTAVVAAPSVAGVPPPAPLARCRERPLIGREREVAALSEALDGARDGRRVIACLSGEPGIGKTRLAAELVARPDTTVLYGRADEDPVVPYEPFVEALRHLCAHVDVASLPRDSAALAPLIPELAGLVPPAPLSDPAADRYRMFEAVVRLLAYAGRRRAVVLVLEDLQWADKATLLLLRHVLESAEPERLAAIVSYRPLWVGDDHPLRDVLTGIARRHDLRHVALGGLSEAEVGRLAADRLGHEPAPAVTHALVERTSGNPLFVEELLRDASDDPAATTTALPETVRHIVRRRLERLSGPTRDVLAAAALLGGEFDALTLAAIAGDDAEDALAEAASAGVVVEHDGRCALAHSLIRDVLAERTPGPERRRLHLRIAQTLEPRGAEPAVLARHFRAAHATERALHHSVAAGRAATAAHGHERAAEHFDAALALLDAGDDERRRGLLLELGDARLRASQPRCLETFGAAADFARAAGDPPSLAEAALGLAGRFTAPGAGDTSALAEALAALPAGDSALRVRVLSRYAQTVGEARALELSAEALASAARLGDEHARVAALGARHAALLDIDHLDERSACGRELVSLADTLGELEEAALARHWHLVDLFEAGEHAAARREQALLEELAGRLQQPLYHHSVLVWQGVWALLEGDPDAAEALAARALDVAERMRAPDARDRHAAQLLLIRRAQGRAAEMLATAPAAARPSLLRAAGDEAGARAALAALDPGALPRGAGRLADLAWLAEAGDERAARALAPYAGRFVLAPFAGPLGPVEAFLSSSAASRS